MALLKVNGEYIKLQVLDNNNVQCDIYKNKIDRDTQKTTAELAVIISKYKELCLNAYNESLKALKAAGLLSFATKHQRKFTEQEQLKINEIMHPVQTIQKEYHNYLTDIHNKSGATHSFPIIAKYIDNPEAAIPKDVTSITMQVSNAQNIEEAYNKVKQYKIFGQTIDC